VGIFEKLEKALAFDSDVVSEVTENIELILARFQELMSGEAQQYLDLCRGYFNDKTVERAIDVFAYKEKHETFYLFFKQIETLYKIFSPSPELRDYIEDFKHLTCLYEIIRNLYRKKTIRNII